MRDDSLARTLDQKRWQRSAISWLPAYELYLKRKPALTGHQVADVYGLLAHYTTQDALVQIYRAGYIGNGRGCWLTPTPYAACMAPYDLGLRSPRDVCLLVDVRDLQRLWGPGTAAPSSVHQALWRGGAVEFFSPESIDFRLVKSVLEAAPCGDRHQ